MSQRAIAPYIGVNNRSEICANLYFVAAASAPTSKADYKYLEWTIKQLPLKDNHGLNFRKLHIETIRIVVFTDISLANTKALELQLSCITLMTDQDDNSNIVYFR